MAEAPGHRGTILKTTTLLLAAAMAFPAVARRGASHTADELFSALQARVFQIRVIDNNTGKKSEIGSGFSISPDGLFATNYHVVADVVIEPERFRLDYIGADGRSGPLHVIDVDVVHDLAVVAADSVRTPFFTLSESEPVKGEHIFSMGNPLDLGMTIIEGTYSGLIQESLYEKIHFSGSLNPGMSGGPAFESGGRVIGVNVSTAGEEISFLVPAKHLRSLLDTVLHRGRRACTNFTKRIEQELFDNQQRYMGKLLAGEWKHDTLGRVLVPREMGSIFKCWGETEHDTDVLYTVSSAYCANEDDLFLSSNLTTGSISFDYHWYEGAALGTRRFYRMLQEQVTDDGVPNYEGKKELEAPRCNTRFVSIAGADWKATLCTWRYKKYPRLGDVVLKMALVNKRTRSMLVTLKLLGVSPDMGLAFCRKFMGALRWRN